MSTNPLISVILPSYNHAEFVTIAVESVLSQTVENLELIVVDDGSTDGTPDLVEHTHDPRLQLIRLEQNRLRHSRNLALGLARGQYIAFQNSDDVWLSNKLEAQLKIMKEREAVVACFTDVEVIDHQGRVMTNSWANGLFTRENRSNLQWLRYFFETGNCLCISSALVRRDAIEQVGRFKGSFIHISDFDLWVRLAARGELYIVQEKLICFRDTTGNIASSQGKGNLSGPNINGQYRSIFEFAILLEHYAEHPIVDLLPQIFAEIIPTEPDIKAVRLAQLAQYAWSLNTVYHSWFADNIISHIIDDETARKDITDFFGATIIQEFINRRGNLALHFVDQIQSQPQAQRNAEIRIADLERTVDTILHSRSWTITRPFRAILTVFQELKGHVEKLFRH